MVGDFQLGHRNVPREKEVLVRKRMNYPSHISSDPILHSTVGRAIAPDKMGRVQVLAERGLISESKDPLLYDFPPHPIPKLSRGTVACKHDLY